MKSADIFKLLKAAGWVHCRTKGSHYQFKHATLKGLVTVPHPKKDLPLGTLKSIALQAGVKLPKG